MKTFLISLGIVGVLAVTALLVAPSVIDWNAYRGALADELSRTTGHTVSLDGPLEASFLPAPRILANNVRLSARRGASGRATDSEDFLRLRAVELRVGLLPLLTGNIVVERLTLVRPEFLVDTDTDGTTHWVMDGAGGDLLSDVALQRLAVSDGTLVWRDRRNKAQTRIENISLRLTAQSMSGPGSAEGTARIGDTPVKFTASVGEFRDGAPVRLNASIEAAALKAKSEFVGQFVPAEGRVTGRLKASGSDARAVLAGLAGGDAAQGIGPALIAHRFAVEARVSAGIGAVEANDVVLDLADQRATGTVNARLATAGSPTSIDAALRVPRLNLDSLATVPSIPATASAASALPKDVRFALALDADAVIAGGRVVQGFAVDAALDRGAIAVKRMEGQLPGAGSFRLTGAVAAADGGYRFDGSLESAAANLRDLLSWLDIDTRSVPGGRLANATLKAKLSADQHRAELRDLDLHVDSTRAHGSVRLDYRDRPKLALDLAADQLDVDAYTGDESSSPKSETSAVLADLTGEAQLSIGQLTYGDVDMRNVDLTAAIKGGDFNVSYFSGGPPDLKQMFATNPSMPKLPASPQTAPPVAAIQAPAVAHDAETIAVPVPEQTAESPRPVTEPEPASSSRDDFVRDLLGRTGR